MESKKLLPAIVALLLIASVLSISTTSVSAATTVSIDRDLVKANTPMVLTITVTAGTSAIDNVRIILEAGSDFAPLKSVPKDNVVRCYSDNIVVLPAGTVVELLENENILLPENTRVWVDNNKYLYVDTNFDNTRLKENAEAMVRQDTKAENIPLGDNIQVTRGVSVYLENDNRLLLLAPTSVVLVSGNIVKLPENTLVGLYARNDNGIPVGENVEVTRDITVTLADNRVRMVNFPANSKNWNLTGENVQLYDNQVIVRADTIVRLGRTVRVRIAENENMIREKDKQLDVTLATVENKPLNWTQTTGITDPLSSVPAVEWKGIGDNKIPAGGSLAFPFALTTPSSTEDRKEYSIWVRTPEGIDNTIKLKVDGKAPTVTVTASPSWVKDNVAVTITVTASESLSKLENVMVAENKAPENTQVTMTSTDNITWTGTYTTGDNWLRDGEAKVYVIGSQVEDLVGNVGSGVAENKFTIDRCKPPTPNLGAITGFPSYIAGKAGTNIGTWVLEGTAKDNLLGAIDNLKNGTVRIRVGTATYDVPAGATGYFYKSITLTEGTQEVGIRCIDLAGNVGDENAENVTYDKTKPSISITSPADGARIKDNTPTITLTITDAVLGVENRDFNAVDNGGYSVQLQYENGTLIDNLVNSLAHDNHELGFENTIPTAIGSFTAGLPDNTYRIYVVAGDNLQMDNKVITFVVDTLAPSPPTLTATASSNPLAPDVKMTTSVALGGTCEAGATVKVWTSPEPFTVETVATSVVDTDGDGIWSASITISQGVTTKISVSQVDIAGNESGKRLYGYLMVDATAPTVVITSPATGTKTDKASITVSGTVTKDTWETWSDITLKVQVGLTGTTVPISAGAFSVDVPLAEGTNTIIATATDPRGWSGSAVVTVERTVTPWGTYAIILVIVALILSAVAIFKKR